MYPTHLLWPHFILSAVRFTLVLIAAINQSVNQKFETWWLTGQPITGSGSKWHHQCWDLGYSLFVSPQWEDVETFTPNRELDEVQIQIVFWPWTSPGDNVQTVQRVDLFRTSQRLFVNNVQIFTLKLFTGQMILNDWLFLLCFLQRLYFFRLAVKTSCLLKLIRTLTEHSDIPQHLRSKYFGPVQT